MDKKAKEFERKAQAEQESKAKEKAKEKAQKKKQRLKKLKQQKAKELMQAIATPATENKEEGETKNTTPGPSEAQVDANTTKLISKPEFMGFPLAGGPDDDVSKLLSRDLFQQHLEKARSNAIGLGPNLELEDAKDNFTDFFDSDLFNPFLNKTTQELNDSKEEKDGLFISDNEPLFN